MKTALIYGKGNIADSENIMIFLPQWNHHLHPRQGFWSKDLSWEEQEVMHWASVDQTTASSNFLSSAFGNWCKFAIKRSSQLFWRRIEKLISYFFLTLSDFIFWALMLVIPEKTIINWLQNAVLHWKDGYKFISFFCTNRSTRWSSIAGEKKVSLQRDREVWKALAAKLRVTCSILQCLTTYTKELLI